MSHAPHLNQGGSDFGGTTVGQRVNQGNRTYNRDNTNHVTYNYYYPCPAHLEDRGQEPREQKQKSADDQVAWSLFDDTLKLKGTEAHKAMKQLVEDRYHALLESLKFKQIHARYENIQRAHGKTCKWLLGRSEYLDWLNPDKAQDHHGFLWVKGKPGAGKSTLMKFMLSDARTKMKNKIITFFFFNARGEKLEQSTVGMYRSLLLQLLERIPTLRWVIVPMLGSGINVTHNWSVESLKAIFEHAVQSLKDSSLVVFIDALDECDEADIRNMISFFEELGNQAISAGTTFQVCFASRHYPHITISRKIELVLEDQEGHEEDIISYLNSELKIGNNRIANEIRAELKEKASGAFMWVVLVVGILQREYDYGRSHTLRQKLREIPRDLHELFRDILTRDDENKDGLLLCIQWLLFARQPLTPEQLYFAIRSSEDQTICKWDREEVQESSIRKFILSSSKGLAETTKSTKEPTVQFIHESVRDFLLKEDGLKDIWPSSSSNLHAESHHRLKQCCLDYTIACTSFLKASPEEVPAGPDAAERDFPFLSYAVRHVLYHANAAEECGISQTSFLLGFPLTDWINHDNIFRVKVRRHTPNASLLYILAEQNLAHLIASYSRDQSCFLVEDERYGAPILAAAATASHAAVWRLLKREIKDEPPASPLHDLCDKHPQYRDQRAGFGRNFRYSESTGLFSYLVQNGDETLLAVALTLGKAKPDLEKRTNDERTALSIAASAKSSGIVQMLLNIGAVLNTTDNRGRAPLSHAAESCDDATVRLLVAKGANIEEVDKLGLTPLLHAIPSSSSSASKASKALVLHLLINHATINRPGFWGQTPLMYATISSNLDTMKLLIDRGANINMADNDGFTALMHATAQNSSVKMKLLIDEGADLNLTDNTGHTALSRAAKRGILTRDGPMRLLIGRGASVDIADTTSGRTILSYGAVSFHPDMVLSLLDRGVPINKACTAGRTPLSYAAGNYSSGPAVEALLSRGATVDVPDVNGRTPLSYAAENYSSGPAAKALLSWGAAVDVPDMNGRTPLSYAAGNYSSGITAEALLIRGAAIDVPDVNGRTPLSYAAGIYSSGITVKALLSRGATVDMPDVNGRTPLSYAVSVKKNDMVVRLLLDYGAGVNTADNNGQTPILYAASTAIKQLLHLYSLT